MVDHSTAPARLDDRAQQQERKRGSPRQATDMPAKRFRLGHQAASPQPSFVCDLNHDKQQIDPEFCALHVADSDLPKNEASALLAFGRMLAATQCGTCQCRVVPNDAFARAIIEQVLETSPNGYIWCRCCFSHTCVGCGKTATSNSRFTSTTWCCIQGRLLCVWLWLCGLEASQPSGKENAKPKVKNVLGVHDKFASTKKFHAPKAAPPLPFKPANPKGLGYGGPDTMVSSPFTPTHFHGGETDLNMDLDSDDYDAAPATLYYARGGPQRSKSTRGPKSELSLLTRMFPAMTLLLPDKDCCDQFSISPPALVQDLLAKSGMLEAIATLLRNDSFEDILGKYGLYTTALDVIGRLTLHPTLALLITGPRQLHTPSIYRMSTTITDPECQSVTPIHELLKKLHVKLQKLRHTSASMTDAFLDREGQLLLKLCEQISMVHTSVQEVVQAQRADDMSIESDSDATLSESEARAKWHREHCIEAIEESSFEETVLLSMARASEHRQRRRPPPVEQAPAPGRMKRIINEINTLQSALPEGIFVRYGSSRPDLMQVLIIGPRDTPYEQGLFEFDLSLPPEYPQKPPKMHFKTTAKGRAHFNPNLYTNGMVCLSLLGTWAGTPWDPQTSTLLQVFVSMQAMIFCDEPWYNEPGRENREDNTSSSRYNVEIQALTMEWALTAQMSQRLAKITGEPDRKALKLAEKVARRDRGEKGGKDHVPHTTWFEDVFDWHFRTMGTSILEQLRVWDVKAGDMAKHSAKQKAKGHPVPSSSGPVVPPQHPSLPLTGPVVATLKQTAAFAAQKFWHPTGQLPNTIGAMYNDEDKFGVVTTFLVPKWEWSEEALSAFKGTEVGDKLLAIASSPQPTSNPNGPVPAMVQSPVIPGPSGTMISNETPSPNLKKTLLKAQVEAKNAFPDMMKQEPSHTHEPKKISTDGASQNSAGKKDMGLVEPIDWAKLEDPKAPLVTNGQASSSLQTQPPPTFYSINTVWLEVNSSLISSLGFKLAALAQHFHSPLITKSPPNDKPVADPKLPKDLQEKLTTLAYIVKGTPLVVVGMPSKQVGSQNFQTIIDLYPLEFWQSQVAQLGHVPPQLPLQHQMPSLEQSHAQKAQAVQPKYVSTYYWQQLQSTSHVSATLPAIGGPTLYEKALADAQAAGVIAPSGPQVGVFASTVPWTKSILTSLKKKSPTLGPGPQVWNPPGSSSEAFVPSSMSASLATKLVPKEAPKQPTCAHTPTNLHAPKEDASPKSVLAKARAATSDDIIPMLDMQHLNGLVLDTIKELEVLKAVAPADERDTIEGMQKDFCAEMSVKVEGLGLGLGKVYDLEEVLELIHDDEESEEEDDMLEDEEWEQVAFQGGSCTPLKGLVDEFEGVLKEYLRAVGI